MSDYDVNAVSQKLETTFKHGYETLLLAAGFKLKLFDSLGDEQAPRTSVEIAELSGLKERYIREWLNGMVTSGFITCDQTGQKYWMTKAAKVALINAPGQMTGALTIPWPFLIKVFDQVCECFQPDGPRERGITCLDLGCGTGTVSLLLGARFPQSQFYGVDLFQNVIDTNTNRAKERGLSNVHFLVADAKQLPSDWSCKFDYVTAFDVVHDLAQPDLALKEVSRILKPGGPFSMFDLNVSSNVHENIQDHRASVFYTISLFHSMTVSLSFPNGVGLGIMMGREKGVSLLKEAGFRNVQVVDQPWDKYKLNAHFLCVKDDGK